MRRSIGVRQSVLSDEVHHIAEGAWHFVCEVVPSDVEELGSVFGAPL